MVTWSNYTSSANRGKLIGLEIETESHEEYEISDNLYMYWNVHNDGSLRFVGKEFVFKSPYAVDSPQYNTALELFDKLAKTQKFEESVYSSVHVHFNMEPLTLQQIANFISLYYLFEETLGVYCGNDRNGNLFCLKTSVAEYQANRAAELVKQLQYKKNFGNVNRTLRVDSLKYSGLNLATLAHISTLEVRTHKGTTNVNEIKLWINILHCIYDACEKYTDPKGILTYLHTFGFNTLFLNTFGEYSQFLDLQDSPNGYWYVHEIAHAVKDWSTLGELVQENKKIVVEKIKNVSLDNLLVPVEEEEYQHLNINDINMNIQSYTEAGYSPQVASEGDW